MMPKLAKLLVVDDEPFNLEIIAEHLDGACHAVRQLRPYKRLLQPL